MAPTIVRFFSATQKRRRKRWFWATPRRNKTMRLLAKPKEYILGSMFSYCMNLKLGKNIHTWGFDKLFFSELFRVPCSARLLKK